MWKSYVNFWGFVYFVKWLWSPIVSRLTLRCTSMTNALLLILCFIYNFSLTASFYFSARLLTHCWWSWSLIFPRQYLTTTNKLWLQFKLETQVSKMWFFFIFKFMSYVIFYYFFLNIKSNACLYLFSWSKYFQLF